MEYLFLGWFAPPPPPLASEKKAVSTPRESQRSFQIVRVVGSSLWTTELDYTHSPTLRQSSNHALDHAPFAFSMTMTNCKHIMASSHRRSFASFGVCMTLTHLNPPAKTPQDSPSPLPLELKPPTVPPFPTTFLSVLIPCSSENRKSSGG
ncbi:hypothetical protein BGZ61DRAFT_436803 [Ilyonectria robusta]|uniref:uncharacterized protein n=1 Tax=Ilyonectria robusta TaxID=1079257 RepID=UPI001E8CFF9D|nr:uncharacterized protein BGZ61DRAFT_436803 [Ilyonectria robusta]KAH8736681.1 hypothetical protein BGZ61DRAFT_436803 [Ilyonectria robusta]